MADRPQIVINEIDSTGKSREFDVSSVSAGFGYFKQGEAFKPVMVSSANEFENQFGRCYLDNIYDHRTFMNFFRESGGAPLYCLRMIHNELPKAGIVGDGYAFSSGSANAGLGIKASDIYTGDISLLVMNNDEFISKMAGGVTMHPTEILRIYYKWAGEVGNQIKIAICNETNRANDSVYISGTANKFKDVFKYPLGNTANNYEVGIIVMDNLNNILEKWIVSTVNGHKNVYGENNYVEDYLFQKSQYIRAFHNKTLAPSVVPTKIVAQYLMGGSSAPVGHHMPDEIADFLINSKGIETNQIVNGLKLYRNSEEYQYDLFIDSGYSFDFNVILNVKTDSGNNVNLVVEHSNLVANLFVMEIDQDSADMELGEKVRLKSPYDVFIGFGKCLAKYGYYDGAILRHFIVVETDFSVTLGDKIEFNGGLETAVVLDILSLNSKLKGHGYIDGLINTYLSGRMDHHEIIANGVTIDMLNSLMSDATFEGLADSYISSTSIDGTSRLASYISPYFNLVLDYVPDLDVFEWIPVAGLVAGRFIKTDKIDGQFYANAGVNRGVTSSTTLLFSPSEGTRIKLNEKFINTLYIDNDRVVLDGNKTMFKPNSYFGSIDIRRTSLYIKKISNFEALRLQFKFNAGTRRNKLMLNLDKKMDELKNTKEAISEYKIIDASTLDDERLDRARIKIGFKPITTTEFVFVTLSLDDVGMVYEE